MDECRKSFRNQEKRMIKMIKGMKREYKEQRKE